MIQSPYEQSLKWTRWLTCDEIARAALILGVIPDYSKGNKFRLNAILRKRVAEGLVQKRKAGPAQNAKAEYRSKLYTAIIDEKDWPLGMGPDGELNVEFQKE
jgi:hypothetical protein